MTNPYAATMGAMGGLGAEGPLTGQAGVPYAGGLGAVPHGGAHSLGAFEDGMNSPIGLATGALGGMLGGLLGGHSGPDPMDYLSQISGQVSPYLSPYSQAGQSVLPGLEKQYGELTSDPAGVLNRMGSQFHHSPGFNFALSQAMRGVNQAAAAGGMAGSPQAMQQSQQIGTQMANQDYYNWLNQAKGMYGAGLQGMQGLAGMGMQAGTSMAEAIANALAAQASEAQEKQAAGAQEGGGIGGFLGDIAGAAMHFLP